MRTQIYLVNVVTRKSRDAKRIRVFVSEGRTEAAVEKPTTTTTTHTKHERQAKMKRAKKEK